METKTVSVTSSTTFGYGLETSSVCGAPYITGKKRQILRELENSRKYMSGGALYSVRLFVNGQTIADADPIPEFRSDLRRIAGIREFLERLGRHAHSVALLGDDDA